MQAKYFVLFVLPSSLPQLVGRTELGLARRLSKP